MINCSDIDWGIIGETVLDCHLSIDALDCSPDGKHIAYTQREIIRIYDPKAGKHFGNDLKGHTASINVLKYSFDGQVLASGSGRLDQTSDFTIRIWDTINQTQLRILEGHRGLIESISFSPNGQSLISGGPYEFSIKMWNWKEGYEVNSKIIAKASSGAYEYVDYSQKGQYILSGGQGFKIRIFNALNGKGLKEFLGDKRSILSVKFSHNGHFILTDSIQNTLNVWSLARNIKLVRRLTKHRKIIHTSAFSQGSKLIVSGARDKVVRVSNLQTAKSSIIHKHTNFVNCAQFSQDNKFIISGGDDNKLRISRLSIN